MNNNYVKTYVGAGIGISALTLGAIAFITIRRDKKEALEEERKLSHEVELKRLQFENSRKEKEIIATYPDSYWVAEKAKHEEATKQAEIKAKAEVQKNLDKLNAEKEMPAAYFEREAAAKRAEEERKAAEYKADKDLEAKKLEIKHEDEMTRERLSHEKDIANINRWADRDRANANAQVISSAVSVLKSLS